MKVRGKLLITFQDGLQVFLAIFNQCKSKGARRLTTLKPFIIKGLTRCKSREQVGAIIQTSYDHNTAAHPFFRVEK